MGSYGPRLVGSVGFLVSLNLLAPTFLPPPLLQGFVYVCGRPRADIRNLPQPYSLKQGLSTEPRAGQFVLGFLMAMHTQILGGISTSVLRQKL